ncbi:MAG: TraR/DksA family transcriptional regulator [Bacteroidetes bacterium]|jgi:RNA polymerase-binding transcription factor DksA|nr:TraR/DksA family transcriptional regulator [Bacteroidota bacterium]
MAKKGTKTAGRKKTRSTKEKPVARGRQIRKGKAEVKRAVTRDAKVKKAAGTKAEPMEIQETKSYPPEELKRFKELILTRRKETVEELDTLKESMMDVTTGEYISESSNYSLHMEQGTDAMEREKTFLFASRGSKFVNQLDDALARIEAKTYGVCKACGLLVPKERLEAVPTAQTCAEYKNTGVPCERGRLALAKKKGK